MPLRFLKNPCLFLLLNTVFRSYQNLDLMQVLKPAGATVLPACAI